MIVHEQQQAINIKGLNLNYWCPYIKNLGVHIYNETQGPKNA